MNEIYVVMHFNTYSNDGSEGCKEHSQLRSLFTTLRGKNMFIGTY